MEIREEDLELDLGNGVTRSASATKADIENGHKHSAKIRSNIDLDFTETGIDIEEINLDETAPAPVERKASMKPSTPRPR